MPKKVPKIVSEEFKNSLANLTPPAITYEERSSSSPSPSSSNRASSPQSRIKRITP